MRVFCWCCFVVNCFFFVVRVELLSCLAVGLSLMFCALLLFVFGRVLFLLFCVCRCLVLLVCVVVSFSYYFVVVMLFWFCKCVLCCVV